MMRFAAAECMTDTEGDVAEFDETTLLHIWGFHRPLSPDTSEECKQTVWVGKRVS